MSSRSIAQQNGDGLLEWLRDVDETGGLDHYRRTISQLYSSPSQVTGAYTVNGGSRPIFDPQFFEDMGVVNVRHRRLFQHWFEEQGSRGTPHRSIARGAAVGAVASDDAQEARGRSARHVGRVVEEGGPERGNRVSARSQEQRVADGAAVRSRAGRLPRDDASRDDRTSESGQDSESGHSWGSRSWWDHSGSWGGSGSWRGKEDWARGSSGQWWAGDRAGRWEGPSGDRPPAGGSDGVPSNGLPATGTSQGVVHVAAERDGPSGVPPASGSKGNKAVHATSAVNEKPSARSSKAQGSDSKRTPAGPLDQWLLKLDRSGALLRYHSPLEDFFDDPQQVFFAYTTPDFSELVPSFDREFFQEAGIVDASHRRIFERWFTEQIETERKGRDSRTEQPHAAAPSESAPMSVSKEAHSVRKWGPGGAQSLSGQVQHKAKPVPASSSTHVAAEDKNESSDGLVTEKGGDRLEDGGDSSSGTPGRARSGRKGVMTKSKPEHRTRPAEMQGTEPGAEGPMVVSKRALEIERSSKGQADTEDLAEVPLDITPPSANVTVLQRNSDSDAQASADVFGQLQSEDRSPASPSKVHSASSKASEDSSKPDPSFASKLQKTRDAASGLPQADPRKHSCVALLGHASVGKSELLASLMQAAGGWDRRTAEKFLKERREAGAKSVSETASQLCATEGRRITFLDAPGHKRSVAQAWSAVSQSDAAVLVVSARAGEFEAGLAKGGQTREHAVLAKCAGMESLIVAVNKMDDGEARWSNLRYLEVLSEMGTALRTTGFYDEQVTYVPVCALSGANVGSDEDECEACAGWYSNGPLLESIESAASGARDSQAPLRISVSGRDKSRGKELIIGRVEQGTVDVGAHVALVPPGPECGVQSIEVNGKEVRQAAAGEIVRLRLFGGAPSPGHALSCVKEPLRAATKFKVQVRLVEMVDDPPVITAGFRCMLHLHGATEEVEVSKLIEAVDPRTKKKEAAPKMLRAPMVALCVIMLNPGREVPVDCNGGRFARFCLRVDGGTIAIGKIAELPKVR